MIFHRSIVVGLLLAGSLVGGGCSALPTRTPSLPTFRLTSAAEPGTPEWWKKNKHRAELVPGQGYRVADVPGFFDANGRPMDAPMAEEALIVRQPEGEPKGLLPGLDPKRNYDKAKAAVGLGPNQQRARELYDQGQQLYSEERYVQAARRFADAAERWPNSSIEQQALYQKANCYFYNDQYIEARDSYVELLEKYPNSGQVDSVIERMWAIGQYWEKHHQQSPKWVLTPNLTDKTRPWFDTQGHAVKTYEQIQLYDPTGPRADDAIMAIAGIHFRNHRYNDADHYYGLLREQYPQSEFQFESHLLGLQTKLRKYQGPKYDGTPLKQAEKLANQLRIQFAGQLSDVDRQRLEQTRGEVARAIVERDMHMAQHYERTQHYGAARIYYAEVVKKHPESALASEARTRLAQIADQPATPDQPVEWLVDLFPENPERTRVARVPELRDSPRDGEQTRMAERDEETVDR